MKDVTSLTEKEILAISPVWPEHLFTNDVEEAKRQYRRLATKWHPDKNPDVGHRVFVHIQALYTAAEERIRNSTWRINGLLKIRDARSGTESTIRYKKSRPFELGHVYVGDDVVAWAIESQYENLVRNALEISKSTLKYRDTAMKTEHARYMPTVLSVVKGKDQILVVMKKTPDQVLLRDVLEHFGGKLEPRHVAWIISGLLNINCYLNFTGVVHHAISPDTVFIGPENHTVSLFGGWWYAARHGQRISVVPTRTLDYGPPDLATQKKAHRHTDSALIRATGRELLGDISGSRFAGDKTIPAAMSLWLRTGGEREAYTEYDHWYNRVLQDAFGPRRFVRMSVKASDIYKE